MPPSVEYLGSLRRLEVPLCVGHRHHAIQVKETVSRGSLTRFRLSSSCTAWIGAALFPRDTHSPHEYFRPRFGTSLPLLIVSAERRRIVRGQFLTAPLVRK